MYTHSQPTHLNQVDGGHATQSRVTNNCLKLRIIAHLFSFLVAAMYISAFFSSIRADERKKFVKIEKSSYLALRAPKQSPPKQNWIVKLLFAVKQDMSKLKKFVKIEKILT